MTMRTELDRVARAGRAAHEWPERLTLRDTKVTADEGQRIYTTATGYGYEKREYVRAELALRAEPLAGPTREAVVSTIARTAREKHWGYVDAEGEDYADAVMALYAPHLRSPNEVARAVAEEREALPPEVDELCAVLLDGVASREGQFAAANLISDLSRARSPEPRPDAAGGDAGWRPIGPEDRWSEPVLCWSQYTGSEVVRGPGRWSTMTHWHPLPAPPVPSSERR